MKENEAELTGEMRDGESDTADAPHRPPLWRLILRSRLALLGLLVVCFWVGLAVCAPLVTPYDPLTSQDAYNTLAPPSGAHWLGTDDTGRDVLSRLAFGGRNSLGIGVSVVVSGVVVGLLLGGLAGFVGGVLDELVMRLADIVFAFPIIVLAMAISAALGASLTNAVIAMAAVWWPSYARVVRGLVLEIKAREYVLAARAVGAGEWRILWRTVLPNTIGPIVVLATLDLGNAILTVAGLSFIGFGVPAPTPEWGTMISTAQKNGPDYWWLFVFPGTAIFTTIIGFNFFGDALRDALDPRTR